MLASNLTSLFYLFKSGSSMPIFQFFFGIGICSVVIDKFKPDTDNLRKTPPDSGTYRLAQATIIFVFIYCIASIPFFQ